MRPSVTYTVPRLSAALRLLDELQAEHFLAGEEIEDEALGAGQLRNVHLLQLLSILHFVSQASFYVSTAESQRSQSFGFPRSVPASPRLRGETWQCSGLSRPLQQGRKVGRAAVHEETDFEDARREPERAAGRGDAHRNREPDLPHRAAARSTSAAAASRRRSSAG